MAEYVESVEKHLLTVGQGFYGPTSPPEKPIVNLGEWCGTIGSAFIRNSEMRPLTFASVHIVSTNGSWRFSVPGMEECSDDFGIIPVERSSIDRLIKEQLYRLMACHGHEWSRRSSKGTC